MSGAGNDDDFERRLAGQPSDPAFNTTELLASTSGAEQTDTSVVFGEMRITEMTAASPKPPKPSPLPWIVAGVLGSLLLVAIGAVAVPALHRASDAEASLRAAERRLSAADEELEALRSRVVRLTRERDAATAESERLASELAETRRSIEEAEASAKRLAAEAAKSPATPAKRRRKRRR
jgi:septal ring factor EnvC (AmiA/AmiB activator)